MKYSCSPQSPLGNGEPDTAARHNAMAQTNKSPWRGPLGSRGTLIKYCCPPHMKHYEPHHQFQRDHCKGSPVINLACKEDCADLGRDFGAVNMDIQTFDLETNTDLTTVPNFLQGDISSIPFPDGHFQTVVLGEVLEHLTEDKAVEILREAKRVTAPGGQIVATFPLDLRPPEEQKPADQLIELAPGCYTYHVTVWYDDMLEALLNKTKLDEVYGENLWYPHGEGRGLLLKGRHDH